MQNLQRVKERMIVMKYNIIDKRARCVYGELEEYTFDELKAYFEPDKEELPEYWEKWNKIKSLFDFEEYLDFEAGGMENPYIIEEVEE